MYWSVVQLWLVIFFFLAPRLGSTPKPASSARLPLQRTFLEPSSQSQKDVCCHHLIVAVKLGLVISQSSAVARAMIITGMREQCRN